jgi:hypothetical protein
LRGLGWLCLRLGQGAATAGEFLTDAADRLAND